MRILIMLMICVFTKAVYSQSPSVEVLEAFKAKSFEYEGKQLPYRVLLPKNFDKTKTYPLHLFLHGAGERGNDNESQLIHGAQLFLENNEEYPAIVIFPQCPAKDYWADVAVKRMQEGNIFSFPKEPTPTWAMRAVITLLDTYLAEKFVDTNRIYLTGLSMGGMGTFELLHHKPTVFAAATPICGGGYPNNVISWSTHTALWIFHGNQDDIVPVRHSQLMVEALLRNGKEPRYTLYPNTGHNSWDNAFAEPDFFKWIYAHKSEY